MDIAKKIEDKYSTKNLLFTRSTPPLTIPWPINGHRIYACPDCGDRFVFETTFMHHVNRKSVQITYNCRSCRTNIIFKNRCNLLQHIRSHVIKTATINLTDLKIEPLPLEDFCTQPQIELLQQNVQIITNTANQWLSLSNTANVQNLQTNIQYITQQAINVQAKLDSIENTKCYECNAQLSDNSFRAKSKHYMHVTSKVYPCPVCMFLLPTTCALSAHIRIHLKQRPYICPECGVYLSLNNIEYPFQHDCDGFKKMRVSARVRCDLGACHKLYHPSDIKNHITNHHLTKIYKCSQCVIACFTEASINKHEHVRKSKAKPQLLYQCDLCPGRLIMDTQLSNHFTQHISSKIVFPCWTCNAAFDYVLPLINHYFKKCANKLDLTNPLKVQGKDSAKGNSPVYRNDNATIKLLKTCKKCNRTSNYYCKSNEINNSPSICPYKCEDNPNESLANNHNSKKFITCPLCKQKLLEHWVEIKKHFSVCHKNHRCLDASIVIKKCGDNSVHKKDIKKKSGVKRMHFKRKRQNKHMKRNIAISCSSSTSLSNKEMYCQKCEIQFDNSQVHLEHLLTHREPNAAYQCFECGQSFVVKRSFSMHLMMAHEITDVDNYVSQKQCFNENAMKANIEADNESPLQDNQCKICRDLFDNEVDLEKHFRVHGMAFLMSNKTPKSEL